MSKKNLPHRPTEGKPKRRRRATASRAPARAAVGLAGFDFLGYNSAVHAARRLRCRQ